MVDKADDMSNAHLISQFASVGISSVALENAADVAKRLCRESSSSSANGDALNPHHANDYQHLFFELSQKTAK